MISLNQTSIYNLPSIFCTDTIIIIILWKRSNIINYRGYVIPILSTLLYLNIYIKSKIICRIFHATFIFFDKGTTFAYKILHSIWNDMSSKHTHIRRSHFIHCTEYFIIFFIFRYYCIIQLLFNIIIILNIHCSH